MMWNDGWSWSDWAAMSLTMMVFWALVIAGVIWATRNLGDSSRPSRSNAADLLAERFAKGEIDEDEYRQKLGVLREQR